MITRARLGEAGLALLGSVVAMWPLTTLLQGGAWLWGLVLLCAFVGAVGASMRLTRATPGAILLVQVVALLVVVILLNVHDHLDSTFFSAIHDLVQDANSTVQHSAAPAPVTPGLLMMLEVIVPGLAIGVDFLAVTCRQPALAGVPMMVIYMLSTSNTGDALNPVFFILLATAWLTMVAHGGGVLVRAWSSVRARALTPTVHDDQLGLGGLASAARTLGIVTILLALIIPVLIPRAGPHYFAQGLGRGGSGNGVGVVAFSTTVSLARDLRSTNGAPVLNFRTSDLSPPPLRVTAGGSYSDGEWSDFPSSNNLIEAQNGRSLPLPFGAVKTDDDSVERLQVSNNTMDAPDVPAPFPISQGSFGDVQWGYSRDTQQPYVSKTVKSYAVDYFIPQRDAYESSRATDPKEFANQLQLDPKSAVRVRALAKSLGGNDTFDEAVRIQNYLRSDQFTYSLTLAPRRTVDGKKLDPLSNFLVTKKGYCTQFATAMIMLARADGIPARMALGFLPGTPAPNGVYTVTQSNAHAWPELYLQGLGWTRFEPTPAERSGAAPSYTDTSVATGGGRVPGQSTSTTSASQAPSSASSAAPTVAAAPKANSGTSDPHLLRNLLVLLGVIVLGLLGALVLPLVARRQRASISARLREHRPVEAQWQVLQTRLHDLGIPPPESESSPRATERYYRSRAALPTEGVTALHTAMQSLEHERYAAPGTAPATIDPQAREILRGIRRQQSWTQRFASTVLPGTGRAAFGRAMRRIADWPFRVIFRQSRDD
ncbi:transglutaminaseTgpA domain-containing protein [Flexivirga oryzae]|uniref:Transglutaminase-like putative cysteine protease n=1 Tax=Flexivirga oryzae TaxID=1794944 RepID=A0A839N1A7_9MICO|nr:transglutaminase-like putative cysteine protease [Flexivirga oryzae]